MSFPYNNAASATVTVADPAGDQNFPFFKFPAAGEVTAAYGVLTSTVAAHATNYVTLGVLNGGTAGTGTDACAEAAGNGATGWTEDTLRAMTISEGTFASGEVAVAKYDENGSVAPGTTTIQIDYVLGSPAGAA